MASARSAAEQRARPARAALHPRAGSAAGRRRSRRSCSRRRSGTAPPSRITSRSGSSRSPRSASDVGGRRRADSSEPVRRRRGERGAGAADQLEGQRMGGHPQPDRGAPAGDLVGHQARAGERTVSGPGHASAARRAGAGRYVARPVSRASAASARWTISGWPAGRPLTSKIRRDGGRIRRRRRRARTPSRSGSRPDRQRSIAVDGAVDVGRRRRARVRSRRGTRARRRRSRTSRAWRSGRRCAASGSGRSGTPPPARRPGGRSRGRRRPRARGT